MTASQRNGKQGSRNPAKKPTSVSAWKKSMEVPPLELPSGNYMRIRKIGLQALIKTGIMPNSLMSIAQEAVAKGQDGKSAPGVEDSQLIDLVNDKSKVEEITQFMDNVMVHCAQEPEVHPVPASEADRDPDLLYVDEVGEEDKMFIFQVVTGGTTDVEAFRKETGATMASIRGRQNVELPAE